MYECTFCTKISTTDDWNKATFKVFGHKDIVKIGRKKDSFHICPVCGQQLHSDNIRRFSMTRSYNDYCEDVREFGGQPMDREEFEALLQEEMQIK